MRQTLSTAATAVIVSLLTLTVAGATAQSEPAKERTVEPTGTNADRVDGKHAVGYTNNKGPADRIDNVGVTKAKVVRVESDWKSISASSSEFVEVACTPATVIIGGGGVNNETTGNAHLIDSFSDGNRLYVTGGEVVSGLDHGPYREREMEWSDPRLLGCGYATRERSWG